MSKSALKVFIFTGHLFLLSFSSNAQTDSLAPGANAIEYGGNALPLFKLRMDSLKAGSRKKIRIVHIGDSHIQPDKFTGEVREELQQKYGNGGRGFMFPYTVAKTNGPKNYTSGSTCPFMRSRNVDYLHKLPLGLAGMVIQSQSDTGSIVMKCGYDSLPNDFTNATLIYSGTPGTEIYLNHTRFKTVNPEGKMLFDTLAVRHQASAHFVNIGFQKGKLSLFGVYVENDQSGIIYNSIGVSGARFTDFCQTDYFFEQLPLLQADLIIVSLGTNESLSSKYTDGDFCSSASLFLSKLKKSCPAAEVILTCPSENYHVRNKAPCWNPKVLNANAVLRNLAKENKLGIWDLYKVMGGKGSMKTWKKSDMVNPDYIHYFKTGYKLQGQLLSKALIAFIEQ